MYSCIWEATSSPYLSRAGNVVKVYLAAPMRGERMEGRIYEMIAQILERLNCKVITPHVLDEEGKIERDVSDEEIFERDMRLIEECDVLIAEVSTPSTGVGIEIQRALSNGKHVVCLYLPEAKRRVSALVIGNPQIIKMEYTLENLENKLKNVIEGVSQSDKNK